MSKKIHFLYIMSSLNSNKKRIIVTSSLSSKKKRKILSSSTASGNKSMVYLHGKENSEGIFIAYFSISWNGSNGDRSFFILPFENAAKILCPIVQTYCIQIVQTCLISVLSFEWTTVISDQLMVLIPNTVVRKEILTFIGPVLCGQDLTIMWPPPFSCIPDLPQVINLQLRTRRVDSFYTLFTVSYVFYLLYSNLFIS
jgi:hypothetical protein